MDSLLELTNGLFLQDRVDRRGRPLANNNDAEIRNLQQEIMDKNKVTRIRSDYFASGI